MLVYLQTAAVTGYSLFLPVAQCGGAVRCEMESVAGMKSFRAFLTGTPGEHLISLYLDVLNVCLCRDQLRRQQLLHKLSEHYLWSISNRTLPADIQQHLLSFFHFSFKPRSGRSMVDGTIAALEQILEAVVGRLQMYWYRRYVIHRALIRCHLGSRKTVQRLCDVCRSVLVSNKDKTVLPFLTNRNARQCDCCAVSALMPWVNVKERREDTISPLIEKDLGSPVPSGPDVCVTVMPSFDHEIQLPRALIQDAQLSTAKQEMGVLTAALLSEHYAGSPFGCFLQQRAKTKAFNCLLFWQEAQALLQSCTSFWFQSGLFVA